MGIVEYHVGQTVFTWDNENRVMGRIVAIIGRMCTLELGDGTHLYRMMAVLSMVE
jgi:hypothetical protein